jgi:hypothetical protein
VRASIEILKPARKQQNGEGFRHGIMHVGGLR